MPRNNKNTDMQEVKCLLGNINLKIKNRNIFIWNFILSWVVTAGVVSISYLLTIVFRQPIFLGLGAVLALVLMAMYWTIGVTALYQSTKDFDNPSENI